MITRLLFVVNYNLLTGSSLLALGESFCYFQSQTYLNQSREYGTFHSIVTRLMMKISSVQQVKDLLSQVITDHGKIMLTELYYLHVSLSIKCTGTSPTRLVIGLICYRHSKPENLEDDCPITMFSGNKRFSSFFCKQTNKNNS